MQLKGVGEEVRKAVEALQSREKTINTSLEHLIHQYRQVQDAGM